MAKTTWDIHTATDYIADAAYSDSHLQVDRTQLPDAPDADFRNVGRLPTEKECEVLVMGDDDGELPDELCETFSQVHGLLQSYF